MSTKTYLGVGVYVEVDPERGLLVLTTENGIEATNTIYLEPVVVEALLNFLGAGVKTES